MPMIKLIDVRMMFLRAAMKKEADRLQDAAKQVARISAGLDMDLKASSGIEEILETLRKNLKNQSSNWTVMRQLAETASAELNQKDENWRKRAAAWPIPCGSSPRRCRAPPWAARWCRMSHP